MATFTHRHVIEGTLTLDSSLTLMSGHSEPDANLQSDEDGVVPEVASVARGHNDTPYIPGSSLKGALHAWAKNHLKTTDDKIEAVFGHEPRQIPGTETKAALGGKAEFCDAFSEADAPRIVRGATRIERVSRTAEYSKLRHYELVPKDAEFHVRITADGLDDIELKVLLAALEGFNDISGIALGKAKGSGNGRAHWMLKEIKKLDKAAVTAWLAEPSPRHWLEVASVLDPMDVAAITGKIEQNQPTEEIHITLRLAFDGPFLVSEAVKKRKEPDEEEREAAAEDDENREPDQQPLRDPALRWTTDRPPILPGSSVRGALRSQAERIWRTVHDDKPLDDEGMSGNEKTPISRLFGSTKQHGYLKVSDFNLTGNEDFFEENGYETLDFVAIDRFTGGAKDGAKFQVKAAKRPMFEGDISLRSDGIIASDLGLLVLLLRDVIEGDVSFGYGGNKGFGHCTGLVVAVSGSYTWNASSPLTDDIKCKVKEWVKDFWEQKAK